MSKKNGSFDEVYGGIGLESMYVRISLTLIRNLGGLGLTGTEFAILAYLLSFKWGTAMPFPSIESLGKALGFEPGSRGRGREEEPDYSGLRKALKRLEQKGFIRIIQRKLDRDRNTTNVYDLKPLFQKLKAVESGSGAHGALPAAQPETAQPQVRSDIRARFGGARLSSDRKRERVVETTPDVPARREVAPPLVADPAAQPASPGAVLTPTADDGPERIDFSEAGALLKAANIDIGGPELTIEDFARVTGTRESLGVLRSDVEAVIAKVLARRAEEWERERPRREAEQAALDARIREQYPDSGSSPGEGSIRDRFGGARLSNGDCDEIDAPGDEHAPDPWVNEERGGIEMLEEPQEPGPQSRLPSWHTPIELTGHVAQMAEQLREGERDDRERYGFDDDPAPAPGDDSSDLSFVEEEPLLGDDAPDDTADW